MRCFNVSMFQGVPGLVGLKGDVGLVGPMGFPGDKVRCLCSMCLCAFPYSVVLAI